jgi:hypothetical protein
MFNPIKSDLIALECDLASLEADRDWMHNTTRHHIFAKWLDTLKAEVEAEIQALKSIEKKKLEKAQAIIFATEDLVARLLCAYDTDVVAKKAEIEKIRSNHPLLIVEAPGPDPSEAPGPDLAEAPGPDPSEAPGPDPAEAPGPDPAEAPGPDPAIVQAPKNKAKKGRGMIKPPQFASNRKYGPHLSAWIGKK